jgi:hypothetical protein
MGKIKLLYDVVTAMKDKESYSGDLKVEGSRDRVKVFGLVNEFEKDMVEGRVKAKVSLEMDCAGKKVKHESSTEFDRPDFHGARQHGSFHHMFFHHGCGYRLIHGDADVCHGGRRGGPKEKLNRLAWCLSVLNSLKAEEREDKGVVLSLDFKEIPGELKKDIQEKFLHHNHKLSQEHGKGRLFKEFSAMEISDGSLNIFINKKREVEKITLTIEGSRNDTQNQPHHLDLLAELCLAG